jgi:hypothetical protein
MDRSTTKPPPRPPAARLAALRPIFERIRAAGGRSLCVGGFVRDLLRGESPLDLDIEVQGLSFAQLSELLAGREIVALGEGQGAKFGVIQSCEAEWALPRRESCQGPRHRDFEVTLDPELPFAEATLRRDFTVNAIAMDALSGELIDPLGGIPDLHRRVLRPVARIAGPRTPCARCARCSSPRASASRQAPISSSSAAASRWPSSPPRASVTSGTS